MLLMRRCFMLLARHEVLLTVRSTPDGPVFSEHWPGGLPDWSKGVQKALASAKRRLASELGNGHEIRGTASLGAALLERPPWKPRREFGFRGAHGRPSLLKDDDDDD